MSALDDKRKSTLEVRPVDMGEVERDLLKAPSDLVAAPALPEGLEGVEICDDYRTIRSLLEEGEGPLLFVSGNAGTGKSTLIRYLRSVLGKNLAVVAPTGVAALNVSGATVHSFFRFPPRILDGEEIKRVPDRRLYRKLELLIIDEISMVRCDLLDSIDLFLRKNRENELPFGGVRLLMVGDLFQLPPVVPERDRSLLLSKGYKSPYFFSSLAMRRCSLIPLELTRVYRQEDPTFIALLNDLRVGERIDESLRTLNERCLARGSLPRQITLTTTNALADKINGDELERLPGQERVLWGETTGRFSLEAERLPSPINLTLKIGARVMFTKNDEGRRWVNGTLGVVRGIDEPIVLVEPVSGPKGGTVEVRRTSWMSYRYVYDPEKDKIVTEETGSYTQFPLMLAWAVTIHKSQGKTLDNALIDLGSGAFASGQVYVALSRCRSLEGITLARPLRRGDIRCDPLIKRFFSTLEEMKRLPPRSGESLPPGF